MRLQWLRMSKKVPVFVVLLPLLLLLLLLLLLVAHGLQRVQVLLLLLLLLLSLRGPAAVQLRHAALHTPHTRQAALHVQAAAVLKHLARPCTAAVIGPAVPTHTSGAGPQAASQPPWLQRRVRGLQFTIIRARTSGLWHTLLPLSSMPLSIVPLLTGAAAARCAWPRACRAAAGSTDHSAGHVRVAAGVGMLLLLLLLLLLL